VDYVNNFVGPRTGTNYHPHLTVGIGTRDFVDALKAEPFEAFTVRAVSVSLYQVGDYGVAQRKLYDLFTAADPLPSWNDGPAKQAILAFVASDKGRIIRLLATGRTHCRVRQRRHSLAGESDAGFRQPLPSTN